MKALKFEIRDLHAMRPDDYTEPEFDIVAHCDDGKTRHTDCTYATRDEAEIDLAGFELNPADDLDQWWVVKETRT